MCLGGFIPSYYYSTWKLLYFSLLSLLCLPPAEESLHLLLSVFASTAQVHKLQPPITVPHVPSYFTPIAVINPLRSHSPYIMIATSDLDDTRRDTSSE